MAKLGKKTSNLKAKKAKKIASIKKNMKVPSRKCIKEGFLLGFIKNLVNKNYSEADKYLQGQVDSIISKKIEDAVKEVKTN